MNAVLECLRRDHQVPREVFRQIVELVRPRCPGPAPAEYLYALREGLATWNTAWYTGLAQGDYVMRLSDKMLVCALCLQVIGDHDFMARNYCDECEALSFSNRVE